MGNDMAEHVLTSSIVRLSLLISSSRQGWESSVGILEDTKCTHALPYGSPTADS